METNYTKEEVLQFTINILSGISVSCKPEETERFGIPISRAIKNLYVLQQMMKEKPEEDDGSLFGEEKEDGVADAE